MSGNKHISLGLVFHSHQPVDQADQVFEEVYRYAYEPLVAALERYAGVRVGLHYTGSLLDWLREHKPEYLERVRALVGRGQVEILSGGYYEPILPAIPDDDKASQIARLTDAVNTDFGYHPQACGLPSGSGSPTCQPTSRPRASSGHWLTTFTSRWRASPTRN